MEVHKQEQRAGGAHRRLTAHDLAASIWDSLDPDEQCPPLLEWLEGARAEIEKVHIPEGKAKALGPQDMFSPAGVDFREGKTVHHETYAGPEQAALVATLANLGIRGAVGVPRDESTSAQWQERITCRLATGRARFEELAASRTGTRRLQEETAALLLHWHIHGRG